MLKKVDELGRITIPKSFRSELNIALGDEVQMVRNGNKIILTNPNVNLMMEQEEVESLFKNISYFEKQDDYSKGFADALKTVLRKENKNGN
jgi:AbrB family looped-hinge helix DNA binding protein